MKRLLAYLFIVLGLGLTFSVNAEAKGICVEIIDNKFGEQLVKAEFSKINNNKIECEKRSIDNIHIDKKLNPILYKKIKSAFRSKKSCDYRRERAKKLKTNITNSKDYYNCTHGGGRFDISKFPEVKDIYDRKTQIPKIEPSQTQKQAKKTLGQCVEGDCTNSVGKYIDQAGNIHTGRFINNKLVAGKREVTTGKYKGSVYVGKFVGYGNLVYGYSKIIQKLNSGDTSVHEEYVSRARVITLKNKNAFKIEVDKKIKELYLIDIDKTQYACLVRGKYVKENFVIKIVDLIKTQELDTCEHKIYRTDRNLFEKLKNVKLDIISEAEVNKIISSAKKTQIAKAEPSQTQKVIKNNNKKYKYNLDNPKKIPLLKFSLNENIKNYNLKIADKNIKKIEGENIVQYWIFNNDFNSYQNIFDKTYLKYTSVPYQAIRINTDKKGKIYLITGYINYKKYENNSFQKSDIKNCKKFRQSFMYNQIFLNNDEIDNNLTFAYIYAEDKKNKSHHYKNTFRKSFKDDFKSSFAITCSYTIKPKKNEITSDITVSIMNAENQLKVWRDYNGILISKFTGDDLINLTKKKDNKFSSYYEYLNYDYGFTSDKKTKVAKVEEPKQEEFIPEKTNQDNIKPIIDIKSEYTFKDAEYKLKGTIKDKGGSEKLYLFSKKGNSKRKLVPTDKKGKFEITGFSIESEDITLIAIDSSNNETEKIVKVIINIEEETEIAKVYEQLKPIKKGKKDNNRVAIIIGVESYEKSSKALYADNDAKMFKYFANKALGISSANIKLLKDNEARRLDIIEALKGWLPRKILKDKSELFVFFSGHGYPSNDNGLYLIPQNGDPRFLEESALSKNYIIEQIQKLQPKSVTMFFDACYSGNGKDGEVLVAGLKPIRLLEIKEDIPENFYIFSSSDYNQESSTIKEAEHGIFSYYLMKGLQGNADENKDKKITNGELIAYLKNNVSQEAFTQNREQDPMLAGDPDKILMSYR